MRRIFLFLLLLTIATATITYAYSNEWEKGVVIVVYGQQYGTGFWVSENTLVTAAHVVYYTQNANVTLVRGSWTSYGTVIYVDRASDIAVISTNSMPRDAHIFPIATTVKQHKDLYVVGYPYQLVKLAQTINDASKTPRTAKGFAAWYRNDYNLIEFQAVTDAGNSGGPVLYENGAVAGVVSFALVGRAGVLYFASDANALKKALDQAGVNYNLLEPGAQFQEVNLNNIKNMPTEAIALTLLLALITVTIITKQ